MRLSYHKIHNIYICIFPFSWLHNWYRDLTFHFFAIHILHNFPFVKDNILGINLDFFKQLLAWQDFIKTFQTKQFRSTLSL